MIREEQWRMSMNAKGFEEWAENRPKGKKILVRLSKVF